MTSFSATARPANTPEVHRAHRAIQAIFLVAGAGLAAWAPMVPFAKQRLDLDEGTLGTLLVALGVGALVAMPLTSLACQRFGVRRVILASGALTPLGLPLLALAPNTAALALTLFAFGASIGTLDISMNAASVEVARRSVRPLLSGIHALYSVGSVVGSVLMSTLLRAGLPLVVAASALCVSGWVLIGPSTRKLLEPESAPTVPHATPVVRRFPWRVVGFGGLCFVAFVTEGAMLDWSAVYLQSRYDVAERSAGFGYAAFAVAMVLARLVGDRLLSRFGPVQVIRGGAMLASAGFLVAALSPVTPLTLLGFVMVGLGASNVVPTLFGAAGRDPHLPAATALAIASTLGYAGGLIGPPVIGAVAAHSSLAFGFVVVAVAMWLVVAGAGLVRR